MGEVSIIGIDLAKNVFQLHGMMANGSVAFRRKLSRSRLLPFLLNIRFALWRWKLVRALTTGAARSVRSATRFV